MAKENAFVQMCFTESFKHADVEKYFIQNSPALKENQRGFAD